MIEIKKITANETWQLRHEVMWADKPLEFVILENDNDGFHYGLFKNNKLISVISLFKKEEFGQFRKFATDKTYQGNGFGSLLLNYLINDAKTLKIKQLSCDARTAAISFYEKFGMKATSKVFQKNGKDYVKMILNL